MVKHDLTWKDVNNPQPCLKCINLDSNKEDQRNVLACTRNRQGKHVKPRLCNTYRDEKAFKTAKGKFFLIKKKNEIA